MTIFEFSRAGATGKAAGRIGNTEMPGIQATYLGMPLQLADLELENLDYFKHCAAHDFHLQACAGCGRLRYPQE